MGLASLGLAQGEGNRHERHKFPERIRFPRPGMESEGQYGFAECQSCRDPASSNPQRA